MDKAVEALGLNLPQLIAQVVNFFVLLFILRAVAYKPILKMLDERKQKIAEGLNAAQIHAGRILTEMLRARYDIPAENCTTHGQVSVNPDNMKIGNHTDLGAGFPYAAFGLPDNYRIPPPSMLHFGFAYDSVYWDHIEPQLRLSLQAGDKQLQHQALRRSDLHRRYKEYIAIWRKQQEHGI